MSSQDLHARALAWIRNDPDPQTAAELQTFVDSGSAEDERELCERMSGPLVFGTAGLRGILGAGESRMNRAVIIRTTAGLASYLKESSAEAATQGVVIGYDGRRMSQAFAFDSAATLAGAGIKALLFASVVPTPLVAFAVRKLGAAAGIMITASHNPPEYNGYKVYWSNGAQIIPPHDLGIAAAIEAIGPARSVPQLQFAEAKVTGLFDEVPNSIGEEYLESVVSLSCDSRGREALRIVYTAMHGVGHPWVMAILKRYGFERYWSVSEQRKPDGEFPTVRFPNPEEPGALDLALALAEEKEANLVLVNDPDADRLAVAIPATQGGFRQLTGNEVGMLLGEYILRKDLEHGAERLVMTTVVSSPALSKMAQKFGVRYAETLTGFKWIATTALNLEEQGAAKFVFGYEEALGYTIGRAVRDKDGISAAALFAELTAVAACEGRSVEEELERIARTYGLYLSSQNSVVKKGTEGATQIATMMDALRAIPVETIGGSPVVSMRDYLSGVERSGEQQHTLELPQSNVIAYDIEGGARVVARPSGTEPKIKFYFDVCETVSEEESYSDARQRGFARLDSLAKDFIAHVSSV